jgi:16S rRNA (cytosine967-C5)-methyltransferase
MPDDHRRARARTTVDAARRVAFDALSLVESDGAYLNLALSRLLAERSLAGRDAAFATELAHGTTRLRGSYDLVLDHCIQAGLASLDLPVLTALRLGAHQLLNMRVPSHAAVGTSVELVRDAVGERPVRMVNAVLRRVSGRTMQVWLDELAPEESRDPIGYLSATTSHPRWVVEAFREALDREPGASDRLRAVLDADNVPAQVTLAARPGLSSVDQLVAAGCEPGRWSPYAAVLPSGDPGGLETVRLGRAGVQDEGSQLAALALSRASVSGRDDRWLDLCAGPGGKAALLTGVAIQRQAHLVAVEIQPHRARLVRSSLRGYVQPTPVVVADGRRPPWPEHTFDRAIVDVPCSGLGALRRRPDSRWRHREDDLRGLVELQRRLLTSALASVRAGGVVAYVTCSPHLEETRGVVDAVLATRVDAAEEDARVLLDGVSDLGSGPHVQLWPDLHGTDAMFISVLRRTDPH